MGVVCPSKFHAWHHSPWHGKATPRFMHSGQCQVDWGGGGWVGWWWWWWWCVCGGGVITFTALFFRQCMCARGVLAFI